MAMTFTDNFTKLVKLLSFAPYSHSYSNYLLVDSGTLTNLNGEETPVKIYSCSYASNRKICHCPAAFAPNVIYSTYSDCSYYNNQYPAKGGDNIMLGTGTPSDYALGNVLTKSVIKETSKTYSGNSNPSKVTMTIIYQNISSESVTITEIGTYKCIYQNSYDDSEKTPIASPGDYCMTAYEQLDTPVTIPASAYFNLTLTFELNI